MSTRIESGGEGGGGELNGETCWRCNGWGQLAVYCNVDIVPCYVCDPDNPDADPNRPGMGHNRPRTPRRQIQERLKSIAAAKEKA